ncbi:MAG: hypothetical protein WAX69_09525 [Victivallales bacterium]
MFFGDPDLLSSHEYCTWVEQRYSRTAGTEMGILSDKFIRNYLGRVQDMELPPGKFTIDAGYRKFKLDIFYIEKRKMLPVVKLFREIAAEVDGGIELETHLPDIFLSKYINAVRANDIWINDAKSFAFGPEHFRICRLCSPHRITNLDHIGGNGFLSEKDYVNAHLGTMFTVPGYPVVSVLPDRFGRNTVELVKKLLEEYSAKRKQFLNLVYSKKPGIY